MKGWTAFGILAIACLLYGVAEERENGELGRRLRDATHARDTILARNAEREVRYLASNDSLKRLLRVAKTRPSVIVRHDTALVPVETFVYIRDTVIPQCALCAARTDSLVEAMQAERRIARHIEDGMRGEIARLKRDKLMDRVGVSCGYGVVKVGPDMKAGPGCMASIRVFP